MIPTNLEKLNYRRTRQCLKTPNQKTKSRQIRKLLVHVLAPDGRWGAVEVKLGEGRVNEAAKHLVALRDKADAKKSGTPAFLVVLTGDTYALTSPDGIHMVPLGRLAYWPSKVSLS